MARVFAALVPVMMAQIVNAINENYDKYFKKSFTLFM